ncbi:MAG: hypothetical protein J5978_00750 [Spirochaetaceae bacterium]|nr:hypothetical protein [Spirochaetaceae bacterium]
MPIATKTKTTLLTDDFKNQIANNLTIETNLGATQEITQKENPQPGVAVTTEPKSKYNDVANLHFSRGKKAEFKAFFSAHEVTLVQGVENAVNYIMKEVKAGRLKVSRNGIEKVEE